MQGQQEDLSELSRSQSTDKPKHQLKKHGWEIPRDYAHALQLDIQNGNNKWKGSIDLEVEQIKEYQVFKDYGKAVSDKDKMGNAPKGYPSSEYILFLM